MDRIGLHLDIPRLPPSSVLATGSGTSSDVLREGVLQAREFSEWRMARQEVAPGRLAMPALVALCAREEGTQAFLGYSMSGRAIMKLLAVARTIADLEQRERVGQDHIAEALGFRLREGIGS